MPIASKRHFSEWLMLFHQHINKLVSSVSDLDPESVLLTTKVNKFKYKKNLPYFFPNVIL